MQIPGYSDLEEIGRGGMATVYLARQESLGRNVALKVLEKFDKPTDADRFLNEAHLIAGLDHRNIITIHDIGTVDEHHYIAMEYLAGGDLEKRLGQPFDVADALEIVRVMGEVLDFVHGQGIVHRDVKPANILFHTDGTPILTDFGIAKNNDVDANLTMDGTAVGSPYYLSPEQAECKVLDGRTDIYGLGVVLYELLTGTKPFLGDSHMEVLVAHITAAPPPLPSDLAYLQPLLDRMLAKNPQDRFENARDLVGAVNQLRARHANATRRRKPRGPARRRYLRRFANVGAVTLVLMAAAGYSSIRAFQIESHLQQAAYAKQDQRIYLPEGDSVLSHYRAVLTWDPNNEFATQGLLEAYQGLADEALSNMQFGKARQHIQAGLQLDPENPALRALQRNSNLFGQSSHSVAQEFQGPFGAQAP